MSNPNFANVWVRPLADRWGEGKELKLPKEQNLFARHPGGTKKERKVQAKQEKERREKAFAKACLKFCSCRMVFCLRFGSLPGNEPGSRTGSWLSFCKHVHRAAQHFKRLWARAVVPSECP